MNAATGYLNLMKRAEKPRTLMVTPNAAIAIPPYTPTFDRDTPYSIIRLDRAKRSKPGTVRPTLEPRRLPFIPTTRDKSSTKMDIPEKRGIRVSVMTQKVNRSVSHGFRPANMDTRDRRPASKSKGYVVIKDNVVAIHTAYADLYSFNRLVGVSAPNLASPIIAKDPQKSTTAAAEVKASVRNRA